MRNISHINRPVTRRPRPSLDQPGRLAEQFVAICHFLADIRPDATGTTWHDALRCAFHGVVAWDRVPNTDNGVPAAIIVTGGRDARGGMVCTLKNAIETVLGMGGPARVRIVADRTEAAIEGI